MIPLPCRQPEVKLAIFLALTLAEEEEVVGPVDSLNRAESFGWSRQAS
jgi:hypothetical protein